MNVKFSKSLLFKNSEIREKDLSILYTYKEKD